MEEKGEVLKAFVKQIRKIFGASLRQIILYGSYARGDYRDNSDMDIMILTSLAESEIRELENIVYDAAYEYLLSDGIVISVIIKNESHFNCWLGALPYYDNVKREGVVLAG